MMRRLDQSRPRLAVCVGAIASILIALAGIVVRLVTKNLAMLDGASYMLFYSISNPPKNPSDITFAASAFVVEGLAFAVVGGLVAHLVGNEDPRRAAIVGFLTALALQPLFLLRSSPLRCQPMFEKFERRSRTSCLRV